MTDKIIFETEFRTRVSELQGPGPNKKRIAVLVNGGSFNPIHNGHLEMYVVARNELITTRKLFDDVLIIYCASEFDHVYKKIKGDPSVKIDIPYLKEYTQQIFDNSGTKDRIKICREAFASIDNIPKSGVSSDGKHLSKNMFLWYEESNNPYSNGIKNSAPGTGLTFYGLSGSDYAKDPHFTNGIDDHSIMVSRNKETPVPHGFNTDQKIYITTSSNIDTASSTIRPDLQKLRNFIETATEQQVNDFIFAKDRLMAGQSLSKSLPPEAVEAAAVATIRLLKSVPNSILFRLLTYHEIPIGRRDGKYKLGYMQFRRLLFAQKLTTTTTTKVSQSQHTIVSDTTASELLSKPEHVSKLSELPDDNKKNPPTIEFLQMSTAHALSLEKHTGISASALNFANANSVGGGVLGGSTVQEETLCMMAPDLYMSLKNAAGGTRYSSNWGDTNWDTKFYYSQEPVPVPFTTTDEFTFSTANSPEFAKQYTGHIISAAAYNWKHGSRTSAKTIDIRAKMIKCIKNMAAVAAVKQKCDVLILGAWGCGAFAPVDKENYIKEVAGMFCEALYSPIDVAGSPLKYKDLFKKVIFPIPDCYMYDRFKSAFDIAAALPVETTITATAIVPASTTSTPSSAPPSSAPVPNPPVPNPPVETSASAITPAKSTAAASSSAAAAVTPKTPAKSTAAATPKTPAAAATPKTPAKSTAAAVTPKTPAAAAPDSLTPVEFDARDPWTFYRCLMRGYMMAVIDSLPANAAPKTPLAPTSTSDTLTNQRNRLTVDTKKSILDSDNVFYFDDFTITECDIIIGMVTRLSKWIKFKLEMDAPRQYFTSLADQTALLSNADFFVHQLELAFKDSKHIMSSTTNPVDAASVEPKNETEFLDKLTDYSYNNVGTSKVFAKYDAAKRSVKNATRKTANSIVRFPGAVKSAASATWTRAKTGTKKMWTRRVTAPIEDMKYAKADRAIANADRNKNDAERAKAEIELTREERARPSVVQGGGAKQSFNIDIMAPLKKYKEEKLGKFIEMSDPSMRVENYFELMTKMITTKNAKGEEQVDPAIFGHPLLLYLPFARAFMCGINVYTEAESGPTDEKYTLKYAVPSQYEWKKNQNMPIIHLLDKNKNNDPDFLNATKYSSNFSLLYKK